jgi:hypothetical protein
MEILLAFLQLWLVLPPVFTVAFPAPQVQKPQVQKPQVQKPTWSSSPENLQAPLLPEFDPFYRAPPGYEKAAPGSILRYRPVPSAITLNNVTPIRPKAAWQLQYRTQNSVGDPSVSIVTVLVPFNAKPNHLFTQAYFTVRFKSSISGREQADNGLLQDAAYSG